MLSLVRGSGPRVWNGTRILRATITATEGCEDLVWRLKDVIVPWGSMLALAAAWPPVLGDGGTVRPVNSEGVAPEELL